jgi:RimJ/RimL family protein N-acetyltransferase
MEQQARNSIRYTTASIVVEISGGMAFGSIESVELAAGRFHLRPPRIAEARDVLELALDPEVRMWNPRCRIADLSDAEADCLKRADWSDGSRATFSIVETATERYAGTIALHGIDRANAQAYVGYRVAPWTRGRGAATESLRAVAAWAFGELRLERVALTHGVENEASCRVAQKCGFVLEGVLRSAKRFGDGRLHDEHLHALLASDLRDRSDDGQ